MLAQSYYMNSLNKYYYCKQPSGLSLFNYYNKTGLFLLRKIAPNIEVIFQ